MPILKAKSCNLEARQGFTLVEILIVVSIIGMLASIVLVGLGSFRSRGRDARRAADLREVQNALELYYSKENSYPHDVGDWEGLGEALVDAGIGVTRIADDPLGGDKHYFYGSNGQGYVLGATIEDPNNQVLKDDVDGSGGDTFSVNCGTLANDTVYCLKF